MVVNRQQKDEVLAIMPQQRPFRFLDEIFELNYDVIAGTYRFREDEYFYQGHFPGHPITPGVILIEAMAQTGVVAFGIFLLMAQGVETHRIKKMATLFATADDIEFTGIVYPGEEVIIRGEKVYFRRGNLKTKVNIENKKGDPVCSGILSGKGVFLDE